MSTITWPSTDIFKPATFEIALRSNVLISTSPLSGAIQTVELPGARLVIVMTLDPVEWAEQAEREALFAQIAGQANRVALWHMVRPAPRGTMRGSPTLSATASAGATSLSISTTSGATVLKGDMVKIGSQLVQSTTDATADGAGAMTLPIAPMVRTTVASGQAVSWDAPTATFISTQSELRVGYRPGIGEAISLEFVEVFA
jgi:hypothetical protein